MPCKYSYYGFNCESSEVEVICPQPGSTEELKLLCLNLRESVKNMQTKRLYKLEN